MMDGMRCASMLVVLAGCEVALDDYEQAGTVVLRASEGFQATFREFDFTRCVFRGASIFADDGSIRIPREGSSAAGSVSLTVLIFDPCTQETSFLVNGSFEIGLDALAFKKDTMTLVADAVATEFVSNTQVPVHLDLTLTPIANTLTERWGTSHVLTDENLLLHFSSVDAAALISGTAAVGQIDVLSIPLEFAQFHSLAEQSTVVR